MAPQARPAATPGVVPSTSLAAASPFPGPRLRGTQPGVAPAVLAPPMAATAVMVAPRAAVPFTSPPTMLSSRAISSVGPLPARGTAPSAARGAPAARGPRERPAPQAPTVATVERAAGPRGAPSTLTAVCSRSAPVLSPAIPPLVVRVVLAPQAVPGGPVALVAAVQGLPTLVAPAVRPMLATAAGVEPVVAPEAGPSGRAITVSRLSAAPSPTTVPLAATAAPAGPAGPARPRSLALAGRAPAALGTPAGPEALEVRPGAATAATVERVAAPREARSTLAAMSSTSTPVLSGGPLPPQGTVPLAVRVLPAAQAPPE